MKSENLSEGIKRLRERLGLTQVQLGVKIGKSYPTVQRFESGETVPAADLAKLFRLAKDGESSELAELFRSALLDSIPAEVVEVIREKPDVREKTTDKSASDKRKVRAG